MNEQGTPRERVLTFMVSLCAANKDMQAAEGYLLELLAHVCFVTDPVARPSLQVPAS